MSAKHAFKATLLGLLVCLPGCGGRSERVVHGSDARAEMKKRALTPGQEVKERFAEFEARSFDIPFPLESEPESLKIGQEEESGLVLVTYNVRQSLDQILLFYTQEMERLGWKMLVTARSDADAVMTFEKPRKACGLTLTTIDAQEPLLHVTLGQGPKCATR